ncbi:MAG TPA: hypothetical protein VFE47_12795, partial [Tepidisphaeraceae bacterium]|nr:hypothetical protein [Tepidisphaeraceae bacterium]
MTNGIIPDGNSEVLEEYYVLRDGVALIERELRRRMDVETLRRHERDENEVFTGSGGQRISVGMICQNALAGKPPILYHCCTEAEMSPLSRSRSVTPPSGVNGGDGKTEDVFEGTDSAGSIGPGEA